MSRDPRDPQGPAHEGAADRREPSGAVGSIDPARGAALVTAYVDGVAELLPDERRGVEAHLARDPGARAEADAARALLDRLRALPPEGGEPDWAAMERSIRQAVAAAPPRPWWRRWQWLVPAMTCATAAAVLLVIWPRTSPSSLPRQHPDAATAVRGTPAPPDGDGVVALWLDGHEVDVDVSAPDELGDVGLELAAAPAPQPIPPPIEDADEVGLLPATDLAWVDALDDAALDRVERWLEHPEDPAGPDRRRDGPRTPGTSRGISPGSQENQEKKI